MVSYRHGALFNLSSVCVLVASLFSALPSSAQWVTQSFDLVPGWNAVYTHVDASHVSLTDLVSADAGSPVDEVWLWSPALSTLQFIQSPQQPTGTGSQWRSWERALGPSSDLDRIFGNQALLVRVDGANN